MISLVFPGFEDTLASLLEDARALTSEDLPAFDLPDMTISGSSVTGSPFTSAQVILYFILLKLMFVSFIKMFTLSVFVGICKHFDDDLELIAL